MERQFRFALEADKEKRIGRQTYISNGEEKENDAEHAWHAALMAILLAEYANEPIDVLRTVTMLLIHDMVEIDAGDTYAYDEAAKQTQREREEKAADRIFGMLPGDQRDELREVCPDDGQHSAGNAQLRHRRQSVARKGSQAQSDHKQKQNNSRRLKGAVGVLAE